MRQIETWKVFEDLYHVTLNIFFERMETEQVIRLEDSDASRHGLTPSDESTSEPCIVAPG